MAGETFIKKRKKVSGSYRGNAVAQNPIKRGRNRNDNADKDIHSIESIGKRTSFPAIAILTNKNIKEEKKKVPLKPKTLMLYNEKLRTPIFKTSKAQRKRRVNQASGPVRRRSSKRMYRKVNEPVISLPFVKGGMNYTERPKIKRRRRDSPFIIRRNRRSSNFRKRTPSFEPSYPVYSSKVGDPFSERKNLTLADYLENKDLIVRYADELQTKDLEHYKHENLPPKTKLDRKKRTKILQSAINAELCIECLDKVTKRLDSCKHVRGRKKRVILKKKKSGSINNVTYSYNAAVKEKGFIENKGGKDIEVRKDSGAKDKRGGKEIDERNEIDIKEKKGEKEVEEKKETHIKGKRGEKEVEEKKETHLKGNRGEKEVEEKKATIKKGDKSSKEVEEKKEIHIKGNKGEKGVGETKETHVKGIKRRKEVEERKEIHVKGGRRGKDLEERKEAQAKGKKGVSDTDERRGKDIKEEKGKENIEEERHESIGKDKNITQPTEQKMVNKEIQVSRRIRRNRSERDKNENDSRENVRESGFKSNAPMRLSSLKNTDPFGKTVVSQVQTASILSDPDTMLFHTNKGVGINSPKNNLDIKYPVLFNCSNPKKNTTGLTMCRECPMRQLISKIDPAVSRDRRSFPVIAFTCCRRGPKLVEKGTITDH